MKRVMTSELTLMQRIEAFFHMTPHFAYPLMVVLSVLLLPALIRFTLRDRKLRKVTISTPRSRNCNSWNRIDPRRRSTTRS